MTTLTQLFKNQTTAVWGLLIAATLASWWLGTDHGLSDHRLATVLILVVAFVKVRFVGMYFMEHRNSPVALRAVFQGYCLAVCAVLVAMYLWVG
jgi:heme/copper-type cytochrome/quinol oxidase subunit 4